MPSVEKKPNSERLSEGQSGTRVYSCLGYATAPEARAAVHGKLTAGGDLVWDGLVARTADAHAVSGAHGAWDVTIGYGPLELLVPKATGSVSYQWQTRLEAVRINQAKDALVSSYKLGGGSAASLDMDGAIGVVKEPGGRVRIEGADIFRPVSSFTVTIRPANGSVDQAYRVLANKYVGAVNSDPFEGYAAGEVLFNGIAGGERSDADSELSLEFLIAENETGLTVGGITGIAKQGWDLLDPYRELQEVSGQTKSVVTAVFIRRVFPRKDLNDLVIS